MTKAQFDSLKDGQMLVYVDGGRRETFTYRSRMYDPQRQIYLYGNDIRGLGYFDTPTLDDLFDALHREDRRHMASMERIKRSYEMSVGKEDDGTAD